MQRAEQTHGKMSPRQFAKEQYKSLWTVISVVDPTAENEREKKMMITSIKSYFLKKPLSTWVSVFTTSIQRFFLTQLYLEVKIKCNHLTGILFIIWGQESE